MNSERAKTAAHVAEVATMLHKLGHFSQAHDVANQAYRLLTPENQDASPEQKQRKAESKSKFPPPGPESFRPLSEAEQQEIALVSVYVWGEQNAQRTRFHLAKSETRTNFDGSVSVHALCSRWVNRHHGAVPPAELTLCRQCERLDAARKAASA